MEDLSERLLAHFVGGQWRVPFGTRHTRVTRADGAVEGTVALVCARDLKRAQGCLRGGDAVLRKRLALCLEEYGMAEACMSSGITADPTILCCSAEDPAALGAALGAGLWHGLVWAPPPRAAIIATDIAMKIEAADLPPGCFALLHACTPRTAALLRSTRLWPA